MSILLPQLRLPQSATPRFLDFGADLVPQVGGPSQRINFMGCRFALVVQYPRLKPEPDGRILMAALRRAKLEGALFPFPEPGIPAVNYSAPQVNGAGQQGSTLHLKGLTAGITILNGKFLSIIYGGQRYLHHATADTPVGSDGTVALPIFPMLRINPNDGATIELAQPIIEGVLSGNTVDAELSIAKSQPASITITERA